MMELQPLPSELREAESAPEQDASERDRQVLTPVEPGARVELQPAPRLDFGPMAQTGAAPEATEQATGVHIGSVTVQVSPPAEPAKQSAPKPAAPTRLARGFVTTYGLRQG